MDLASGIQLAYERKWAMINTFTVQFILPEKLKELGTSLEILEKDEINISITSLQTPDFTNDPIESYIANRWIIQNGKDSLYRFSMTFKDYDQFKLYRIFMNIYNITKIHYFDDVALSVNVTKDADWYSENNFNALFEFGGTLIEGVSNLSFSNDTENQIGEFSVSFKCTKPIVVGAESPVPPSAEGSSIPPETDLLSDLQSLGLGAF